VMAVRAARVAAGAPSRPILVKIAPDIAEADLPAIVERLLAHKVDGIAVSNTTLSRAGLSASDRTAEAGGLSGRPLFHRSTVVLARVFELTGGRVPLIGIGGVTSGETALQKVLAGATLVQLYTGLVYKGPALIGEIKQSLVAALDRAGSSVTLETLRGRDAKSWAARSIEA
jgi:dihydroorotate dehydrogenase